MNFSYAEYRKETIPVYEPYEIRDVSPDGIPVKTIVCGFHSFPKRYNPFDKMPEILKAINKLDVSKENEIIDFCNQYGMFANNRGMRFNVYFKENYGIEIENIVSDEEKTVVRDKALAQPSVYHFEYGMTLDFNGIYGFIPYIRQIQELIRIMSAKGDYSKFHKAMPLVNALIVSVKSEIVAMEEQFAVMFIYRSLITAIGVHFLKKILEKKEMRFCIQCGNLFTPAKDYQPTDKRYQKFCAPECKDKYHNSRGDRHKKRT